MLQYTSDDMHIFSFAAHQHKLEVVRVRQQGEARGCYVEAHHFTEQEEHLSMMKAEKAAVEALHMPAWFLV